jgi:tRNA-2-methylthio-N6-dimethylallyladenosine synthase
MTPRLLEAIRDLPKVSPYLHVPLQSGSNVVLERMKRGYTVQEYRDMMHRIRETLPEAAVTSDFIVGFSGETEEDFQLTCDAVREHRFKNSFIFKYSVRPGTRGAELLPDDVPLDVKSRRNNELLAIQNAISEEENVRFLGRRVEVLVEGPSKQAERQWEGEGDDAIAPPDEATGPLQLVGRTPCDRIVVFEGSMRQVGQLLPVMIYDVAPHTLFGTVVTEHVPSGVFSLSR